MCLSTWALIFLCLDGTDLTPLFMKTLYYLKIIITFQNVETCDLSQLCFVQPNFNKFALMFTCYAWKFDIYDIETSCVTIPTFIFNDLVSSHSWASPRQHTVFEPLWKYILKHVHSMFIEVTNTPLYGGWKKHIDIYPLVMVKRNGKLSYGLNLKDTFCHVPQTSSTQLKDNRGPCQYSSG